MIARWLNQLRTLRNRDVAAPIGAPEAFNGVPLDFDRDAVAAKPAQLKFSEVKYFDSGRFDVKVRGTRYECFLKSSSTKRLFVFFSAAGRAHFDTAFDRVSWYPKMNGSCLYIEDPMIKQHSIAGGWYYGDDRKSFLLDAIRIVKAVATAKNIHQENILFIGSSASGYAALYAADGLPGSSALAYNPQIRVRDWFSGHPLSTVPGVDLNSEDKFGRNCLRRIAENTASRFFIACNMASPHDYPTQIKPWLDELGITPQKGLVQYRNTHFILHDTPNARPHHVFPSVDQTLLLLPHLLRDGGPDKAAVAAFCSTISALFAKR